MGTNHRKDSYAQEPSDDDDRARRAFREAKPGSILQKDLQELSELVRARAP